MKTYTTLHYIFATHMSLSAMRRYTHTFSLCLSPSLLETDIDGEKPKFQRQVGALFGKTRTNFSTGGSTCWHRLQFIGRHFSNRFACQSCCIFIKSSNESWAQEVEKSGTRGTTGSGTETLFGQAGLEKQVRLT